MAIDQDHLEHGIRAPRRQQGQIVALGTSANKIVAGDANQLFLDVHALTAVVPVHLGDMHTGIVRETLTEELQVARFHDQIQLPHQGAAQLAHDLHRMITARFLDFHFQQPGQMHQKAQIRLDLRLDVRPPHLDHHARTVMKCGAMHLGDGGCGEGFGLEGRKHRLHRLAPDAFQPRPQNFERHRRHVAVQALEFLDPRRREHVHSCRQHLAQLDEGGPQIGERQADTHRQIEPADLTAGLPAQEAPGAFQQTRQPHQPHHVPPAVVDQHRGDFMQARQVPHHGQGLTQHRPSPMRIESDLC